MILLFIVFLYCLAAVYLATAGDVHTMGQFGHDMITFAAKEEISREVDRNRVGCFLLFCHFDDKNSCVHSRTIDCDCREQCNNFAHTYTRDNLRPKTDTCTVWSGQQQCVDECILLLSKKDTSEAICSPLCRFHYSYADRDEYQKRICETFQTWMPNNHLRII